MVISQPKTVLDLGIGFGFYGAVIRQWLDQGVKPWRTYLVAVEAWAAYRSPLWELYDAVIVDSIERFLETETGEFDAVLLMDVLEHFADQQGENVLASIAKRLSPTGICLVGTPAIFVEQGDVHGNRFECHRSCWNAQRLANLGMQILCDGKPDRFRNQMVLAIMRREDFKYRQENASSIDAS